MVPPARAQRRGVAEPALYFVGEGDGLNDALAGSMGHLTGREDGRDVVRGV